MINPLIAKYLQEMAASAGSIPPVPPSWEQGSSAGGEPPQQAPFDIREYFQAMRPEMFSQKAIEGAQEEDAQTNRNREMARSFARASGYFTRQGPDYTGLGPTDSAQRGLQARQQQALQSAEVGSKVGQYQAAQAEGDGASPISRTYYKVVAANPELGPGLLALGPEGTVSKAQIDAYVRASKEGAGVGETRAKGRDANATATRKEELLPGELAEQPVKLAGEKLANTGKALANKNAALLPGKTQAEIDKLRADIAAGKNVTATNAGKRTQELRKEFEAKPQVTNAATINTAHGNITHANDDGFGDLTMIYSYIKLLDPTTGVRESEMANAQRTGGYIDRLRIMAEKPKNGRYLTPEMRKSLKAQADNLLRDANSSYDREATSFSGLAEKENLNPSDVVTPKGYSAPGGGSASPHAAALSQLQPGERLFIVGGRYQAFGANEAPPAGAQEVR